MKINRANTSVLSVTKFFVNVSLILFLSLNLLAQETYNQCSQALEICPNVSVQVNNISANVTVCSPCDDNFNTCFSPNNTIWMKFRTNTTGGATQVDFSNLVFKNEAGRDTEVQATIIKAASPCDGTTYTMQGNCVTNATTNFSLNANLLANTTYYVVVNGAKNGAGIVLPAEFTADVMLSGNGVNRINALFSVDSDTLYCKNQVATFIAHLSNCPDSSSYKWLLNGNLIATTTDSIFQTTALSNGDILTVTNSCFLQCPTTPSASTPALNVTQFNVDAGLDKQIEPGESVQLNGFTDALIYFWTPNFQISDTNGLNPFVSPPTTMSYFLTGRVNNCLISDEVVVTVGLKLEITNTFSPNEDGKNDTWEIPSLVNYPNCLVQIYDRWGQLIFSATGYGEKKAWDGKRNGKAMNEGTYFYNIDLRDGSHEVLKGYLNLVR